MGGKGSKQEYNFEDAANQDANREAKQEDQMDDEMVDTAVCKVDDMKDGEMKVVEVCEGGKVLLVRDHGEYNAIGTKCSHYGAPLVKGALCNGRVRCPWHGACFNVKTGDIEDFPGIDNIPKYQTEVREGEVHVITTKSALAISRRPRVQLHKPPAEGDTRVFIVVGGGAAGAMCIETLREQGFVGEIILLTKENCLPYDRPKLSKQLDSSADKLALRTAEDYARYHVTIKTGMEVTEVDTDSKMIRCSEGGELNYDKVLFATGGSPRQLDIPGDDLENICYLRSIEDGNRISQESREKRVVIVGTSFIGLEVAAYLCDKASSVTVIGRSSVPLKQVLGEQVGQVVKKLLEVKGVQFVFNNSPAEFVGENGKLIAVLLTDGTRLEADVCVVGAGVYPTTGYLKDTGLDLSTEGHVIVDKCMRTSKEDVYAAGDIVQFPLFMADDQRVNIQHWQMASQHGRVAAKSMLGDFTDIHSVPFFWTQILGKSIRYAGYGSGYDDVIIHGDLDDLKFIVYYTKGDKVAAVASMNQDPIVAQAAEMFSHSLVISKEEIMDDPAGWTSRLVT